MLKLRNEIFLRNIYQVKRIELSRSAWLHYCVILLINTYKKREISIYMRICQPIKFVFQFNVNNISAFVLRNPSSDKLLSIEQNRLLKILHS